MPIEIEDLAADGARSGGQGDFDRIASPELSNLFKILHQRCQLVSVEKPIPVDRSRFEQRFQAGAVIRVRMCQRQKSHLPAGEAARDMVLERRGAAELEKIDDAKLSVRKVDDDTFAEAWPEHMNA